MSSVLNPKTQQKLINPMITKFNLETFKFTLGNNPEASYAKWIKIHRTKLLLIEMKMANYKNHKKSVRKPELEAFLEI